MCLVVVVGIYTLALISLSAQSSICVCCCQGASSTARICGIFNRVLWDGGGGNTHKALLSSLVSARYTFLWFHVECVVILQVPQRLSGGKLILSFFPLFSHLKTQKLDCFIVKGIPFL
uniref:T. congolense-specific, cell surface-expressed gene family n=1 Tax=Trypanosoma congolense (strain IL3000) TaxID=1068625 RepID=G0UZ18_TRYCI|nr:hypothetical protein, unlikely [Trypanosoma congolense IL3000]